MNQTAPPTPTEKAQLVLLYATTQHVTIARFSSVKKAEKAHKAIVDAWDRHKMKAGPALFDIDGDMFVCTVDLSQVACISYVDHAKLAKFVPIPA